MFRQVVLSIAAVVGLAGAANAAPLVAPVAAPFIADPAATLLVYDPSLGFAAISGAPVASPAIDPAPAFALAIGTSGDAGSINLTVEDDQDGVLLFATGSGFAAGPDGITALLRTVSDATGLFGPRIRFSLAIPGFDPAETYLDLAVGLSIENAPAPIPLPAGLPLLAGGLALLWGSRRRAAA